MLRDFVPSLETMTETHDMTAVCNVSIHKMSTLSETLFNTMNY